MTTPAAKRFPQAFFSLARPRKSEEVTVAPSLDFHSGYEASKFHNDVNFVFVLISVVEEAQRIVVPGGLSAQFLQDEGLHKMSQERTICNE